MVDRLTDSPRVQHGANPLLETWETPFGVPPFARIKPEHFEPAFHAALAEHDAEIDRIARNPAQADFDNTIAALERSGRSLTRVAAVFYNLTGAHTNKALEAIDRTISPVLAGHRNAVYQNAALFTRVEAVAASGEGVTSVEQAQVLDRYRKAFVRAGAGLEAASKERLGEIAKRLALLGTQFAQNVLADEASYSLVLKGEEDLAGLPEFLRDAAAEAARERGHDGQHVITLSRSSVEPFLMFSARRDLREQAFKAWIARGETGKTDNRSLIAETVALRAERARLLGFPTFADFRLDDSMAKTPAAALALLQSVWTPALRQADAERAALETRMVTDGVNGPLQPWDWRYYAEQVRKAEFDLDEGEIKPYLQLDTIIDAAFYVARKLFGLTFAERLDLSLYHRDVRAFEAKNAAGEVVGLFLGDYFGRASKRSGAWMSSYRTQEKFDGEVKPIIVNVMNFAKARDGEPTLLSFDDARTLFHEFGHALHGLLSNVDYPMIAGTNVARDFVEFPSQLYEHWLEQPEVLKRFALHYRTGEPMPDALIARILASRNFGQGFATVEYVSSALVDLDFHSLASADNLDVTAFEKASLARIGMPDAIVMRHRPTHFTHVFAGDGYSAAYYSYLWSEVLDADGFGTFEEVGSVFDPTVAQRLKDHVYAAGYRQAPEAAYRAFRGRDPDPAALLRKRGFASA
ncbi:MULTISPECIES: M3 family metallopeptidase [unclassified Chelatococcus]|uniref:M3 family metallopeptidase n=1 Tax=unclassified Chelatococcus TaxID=2638111 RepID=UPI001BCBB864|nr:MULTISPECIES: M3 family metallopeptidase [unclassified Chelatococcus]MBS7699516.1 M3 family metallopeptidase [Chelatococcus sp. YT9]MBX3559565.1 M3 family metallopeptidase [Chelatococcus sp.]